MVHADVPSGFELSGGRAGELAGVRPFAVQRRQVRLAEESLTVSGGKPEFGEQRAGLVSERPGPTQVGSFPVVLALFGGYPEIAGVV
jgi:hypothetical protein